MARLQPIPPSDVDPVVLFTAASETIAEHNGNHTALHRKANYVHDVVDYGAKGDGTSDDTPAIQAACDAATSEGGTVFFPPREFLVGAAIVAEDCDVAAISATLLVADTADAGLIIGSPSKSSNYRTIRAPRVKSVERDWEPSAVGLRRGIVVAASDGGTFDIPEVLHFSQGLVLEGDQQGVSYNTFRIGGLRGNAQSLVIDQVNGGWSTQNLFLGGRFDQWPVEGTQTPYAEFSQVKIGPSGSNVFVGCSLEGPVAEWVVNCEGSQSFFEMCRWERGDSSDMKIRFGPNAKNNIIQGGAQVDKLKVFDESAGNNAILQPSQWGWVTVDGD